MADTAHLTSKNRVTFGISVTPAQLRVIQELMLINREFSRSKLLVDAMLEKADRELPETWRADFGVEEAAA